MYTAGEGIGPYRAAVARAVATTQAFIASPSQAQFQTAARSLDDALNHGLSISGVPKEDTARLAASAAANFRLESSERQPRPSEVERYSA